MLIANLIIVLIILGCACYQYLKGTLINSFASVIIAVCASIVAFSYFELLANLLINHSEGFLAFLVPWSQMLCFVLLFILAFAILKIGAALLTPQPIDLGLWPERIGRVIFGLFLGLIVSGLLLTALAMAPLPNKYPYQRFNAAKLNPDKPKRPLFAADSFATAWFSTISKGPFSTNKSFEALHPDYLDQLHLNRHSINAGVTILADPDAIEVPKKNAVWPAPEDLKDAQDQEKTIELKSGHNLTIVRMGIKRDAVKFRAKGRTKTSKHKRKKSKKSKSSEKKITLDAGTFTLSQVRLICQPITNARPSLTVNGKNVYPIGYLIPPNLLEQKQLNDVISLKPADFEGKVKWIDFAFFVPNDFVPVLIEFKQNNIAKLPPPKTAEPTQ